MENLTLRVPGRTIDEKEVQRLIVKLELQATLGSEPLKFPISEGGGNLSGGQKQRIALLALQMQRPILILDEATSALDAKLRGVVIDILNERVETGCTVIVVTHDMDFGGQMRYDPKPFHVGNFTVIQPRISYVKMHNRRTPEMSL